ncbi:MAG: metal ABC transporter permease [Acidobacteria bacterium]|nr:metal ABC transporter permease [Acidobacteriota bacterium]
MNGLLSSMILPFLACLILTGIHAYLGFHVISRKVIFVDLALAQIAAFGMVFAALLGYGIGNPEDSLAIYIFSLLFTFVGAALFALTRVRHNRSLPHEALIGIIYAVASAATILGTVNLGRGAEQVKQLLTGSILWIQPGTVLKTAIIYGFVGLFHFLFRKQFLLISTDPAGAEAQGLNIRWWDFLFYISFGFVITSSVAIAGVLLVFSYLVVPSTIAILFSKTLRGRLSIGWVSGSVISLIGVIWAYQFDLPAGPTIVVIFGAALLLAGIIRFIIRSTSRFRALLYVGLYSTLFLAFLGGTFLFRKEENIDLLHLLRSDLRNERLMGIRQAEELPGLGPDLEETILGLLEDSDPEVRLQAIAGLRHMGIGNAAPRLEGMLEDGDDRVREAAARSLRDLGRPESTSALIQAAGRETDDYIRMEIAETILELGNRKGIPILLNIMANAEISQARKEGYQHLNAYVHIDLPFNPELPPGQNSGQMEAWMAWWDDQGGRLIWNPGRKTFQTAR